MKTLYTIIFCFTFLSLFSQKDIWTGPTVTFSKAANADWTLRANQDSLTSDVIITRANNMGIFNIAEENSYQDDISPIGTKWAFGTTVNIASLTFTDWETTVNEAPPQAVNQDLVLFIEADSIFIDIKFTSWGQGAGGGGSFTYERSSPTVASIGSRLQKSTAVFYPNPASDIFYASGLEKEQSFQMMDAFGRVVKSGILRDNNGVNISDLASGVYIILLEDGSYSRLNKQ